MSTTNSKLSAYSIAYAAMPSDDQARLDAMVKQLAGDIKKLGTSGAKELLVAVACCVAADGKLPAWWGAIREMDEGRDNGDV